MQHSNSQAKSWSLHLYINRNICVTSICSSRLYLYMFRALLGRNRFRLACIVQFYYEVLWFCWRTCPQLSRMELEQSSPTFPARQTSTDSGGGLERRGDGFMCICTPLLQMQLHTNTHPSQPCSEWAVARQRAMDQGLGTPELEGPQSEASSNNRLTGEPTVLKSVTPVCLLQHQQVPRPSLSQPVTFLSLSSSVPQS